MTFFSIIIPTLNASRTLERCISSVLNQEFQDFEILIMDGESKDDTKVIVEGYSKSIPDKLVFFQSGDSGVFDAMNIGLSLAKGSWIYFLGSDDWLYNHRVLDSVYSQLRKTKLNLAYGNVLIHENSDWAKDQEIYAGEFNSYRLTKKNICHQSIFYRKSFLDFYNLRFDLNYPVNADWDLNLRCRRKTNFHFLNLTIANFSSGGLSTNSKNKDNFYSEILSKYPEFLPSKTRILASKILKYIKKSLC